MAGRRVHEAGPRVHRDVLAGHEAEGAGLLFRSQLAPHLGCQWMPVAEADEGQARASATRWPGGFPESCADGVEQRLTDDDQLSFDPPKHIRALGMDSDRDVGGDGPGRRRPDLGEDPGVVVGRGQNRIAEGVEHRLAIREGKHHVDRRVGALLVFQLGLRERGLVGEAPAHRLTPGTRGSFVELAEGQSDRPAGEIHRE